jgi:hypothetical protein
MVARVGGAVSVCSHPLPHPYSRVPTPASPLPRVHSRGVC